MKRGLVFVAFVLSVGCGLASRPRAPRVPAAVAGIFVEVKDGRALIQWRGTPHPDHRVYQVQRRDTQLRTEISVHGFEPLTVEIKHVPIEKAEAPRFAVVGEVAITSDTAQLFEYYDRDLKAGWRYSYRVRPLPVGSRAAQRYRGPETALNWQEPPPAPSNVKLEPVRGGIRLRWDRLAEVSGYRVYRTLEGRTTRATLSLVQNPDFTDLGPGAIDATYVVRAVIERPSLVPRDLEGSSSAVAVLEDVAVLAPAPEALKAVAGTKGSISLSWRPAPTAPQGLAYHVFRRSSSGTEVKLTDEPIEHTTFNDGSPPKGAKVEYDVRAVDAAGRRGPASAPVVVSVR